MVLSNKDRANLKDLTADDQRIVNRAITNLYKGGFSGIKRFVTKNKGTSHDAEDVFQEAIAILYQKAVGKTINIESNLQNFLFGIARNCWLKSLRERGKLPLSHLTDIDLPDSESDKLKVFEEIVSILKNKMNDIGESCKRLLQLFYFEKRSMDFIADALNLANARVAKSKKYKCLASLRKLVNENQKIKELMS